MNNNLCITPAVIKNFTLQESLAYENELTVNRIWYAADASLIEQIFKKLGGGNKRGDDVASGRFWAAVPMSGLAIRKIHSGLPAQIVNTITDLISSDMGAVKFGDKKLDDFWASMADDLEFTEAVQECITDTLVDGDGAFKIYLDNEISAYPILDYYSGDRVQCEWNGKRLHSVTFYTQYTYDKKQYELREIYTKGRIDYELYDQHENKLHINSIPQTAGLKDYGTITTFCVYDGINGLDGADGLDGVGITSIDTIESVEDGGANIVSITTSDNQTTTFSVLNGKAGSNGTQGPQGPAGADGVGISNIYENDLGGGTHEVNVVLTDGNISTFNVYDGADGADGAQGEKGDTGATGPQGTQGINLMVGTELMPDSAFYKIGNAVVADGEITPERDAYAPEFDFLVLEAGKTYTLSFDVKGETEYQDVTTGVISFFILDSDSRISWLTVTTDVGTEYKRIAYTFVVPEDTPRARIGLRSPADCSFTYKCVKLEAGEVTQPVWTPAPQDLVGPAGPQGEQGPQGEKGEKGDTGPQGEQGTQGINLQLGSENWDSTAFYAVGSATIDGEDASVPLNSTATATHYIVLEAGKTYTVSVDVKTTEAYTGRTAILEFFTTTSDTRKSYLWLEGTTGTEYTRLSKTFIVPTDTPRFRVGLRSSYDYVLTYRHLKIEAGEVTQPVWTPAPQDLLAEAKTYTDSEILKKSPSVIFGEDTGEGCTFKITTEDESVTIKNGTVVVVKVGHDFFRHIEDETGWAGDYPKLQVYRGDKQLVSNFIRNQDGTTSPGDFRTGDYFVCVKAAGVGFVMLTDQSLNIFTTATSITGATISLDLPALEAPYDGFRFSVYCDTSLLTSTFNTAVKLTITFGNTSVTSYNVWNAGRVLTVGELKKGACILDFQCYDGVFYLVNQLASENYETIGNFAVTAISTQISTFRVAGYNTVAGGYNYFMYGSNKSYDLMYPLVCSRKVIAANATSSDYLYTKHPACTSYSSMGSFASGHNVANSPLFVKGTLSGTVFTLGTSKTNFFHTSLGAVNGDFVKLGYWNGSLIQLEPDHPVYRVTDGVVTRIL